MKLAFISDIHEDVVSLRLALSKIEKYKVDHIICLGDISGYNPIHYNYVGTRNAHECLNIVKQVCSHIVLGNHDYNAIGKIPEFSPGFDFPPDWYDLDYFEKKHIANNRLWCYEDYELKPKYSRSDIEFLSSLKQFEIFKTSQYNIFLSHYVYPNISGMLVDYYMDKENFNKHFEYMKTHGCSISINGHEHTPGLCYITPDKFKHRGFGSKTINSRPLILMCPSVADGRNRKGFLIFDTETQKAQAKPI